MPGDEFFQLLSAHFPADFLSREPSDLVEYGRDWTRAYEPAPCAVAFPRTTAEVARLLLLCHDSGVGVVPSGGRTGLAGGAVAARGELVLSLSRMSRMAEVDQTALTVRVQAGAVTQAVHQHAAQSGLTWPIDLAAKGSCQIGGNIATNAGGVKVIRYGLTRHWVLGLQVVTASGEVLELGGALEKNNTGCDLRQLFIGSEGTLGVITEATLKLVRLPGDLSVFLFAVSDLQAVLRLFHEARRGPFTIMAYEFMARSCVQQVCRHRGLMNPLPGPLAGCYVLMETERPHTPAALSEWLEAMVMEERVVDGVLAQSQQQAQELWALREGISETLSRTGLVHKNDVSLPIAQLQGFCAELDCFFAERYPGWEVFIFGHVGDGNLHVNVMKPESLGPEVFRARTKDVDHDMFRLVRKYGGSISAEHGIGLLKKDYLSYSRTPAEMEMLRGIKRTLDPRGILNPGKIFD